MARIDAGEYIPDPDFIQNNRTWHALFLKHLTEFTAFDAGLDAAYAADWLAGINDFEALPTDETMRDEVQEFTDAMQEQRTIALTASDDILYYVKRAFPDEPRMIKVFGFNLLRTTRSQDVARLFVHFVVIRTMVDDYLAELTTSGLTPATISNFEDQTLEMLLREIKQEHRKHSRLRLTGVRIVAYNALFKFNNRVRDAAKIIFRTKPETAKLWQS